MVANSLDRPSRSEAENRRLRPILRKQELPVMLSSPFSWLCTLSVTLLYVYIMLHGRKDPAHALFFVFDFCVCGRHLSYVVCMRVASLTQIFLTCELLLARLVVGTKIKPRQFKTQGFVCSSMLFVPFWWWLQTKESYILGLWQMLGAITTSPTTRP